MHEEEVRRHFAADDPREGNSVPNVEKLSFHGGGNNRAGRGIP